ncbi:FAD:protein FMN transferase [Poseidonibacter ostreae]|jgi:FAD:protein FMN transferase|uniref:FAD:protein FMN transferase n=2 Tax=Poseidonibacter ostreae TaxID=2654171 RepID=A0A6L4WVJ9_9BACT|nr:FAD:protein FMN transferase [Poseidonibacter ostreae]KAB7892353.1 FAD:protein FMN transferase [Poseidonibacter ostreae]
MQKKRKICKSKIGEKQMAKISRRKFLTIAASSLSLSLPFNKLNADNSKEVVWSGVALGAESKMTLFHEDRYYAKESLKTCINEIKRLENIFSLFDKNSSISKLNKYGVLENPPKELVEVLTFAHEISEKTNGAFDVTVQPLWLAHDKAFKTKGNDKNLKKYIKKASKLVSYKNIIINKKEINFKIKDMKITLNGIAQGYITDRITNILEQRGFKNVLINLGEFNSIGGHKNNRDWNIATPYLKDIKYLKLNNNAMASSGGYGTKFNKKYHHLFDTKTGTSANYIKAVTVKAENAMLADALATAFCVMPKEKSKKLKNIYPNIEIYTS